MHLQLYFILCFFSLLDAAHGEGSSFSVCSLLGPRFSIPQKTASSSIIQTGLQNLTTILDAYLLTGDGEFGPITPATTSFSLALFSTEQLNSSKPFFYEYHHSAASLSNATQGVKTVDANTIYRIGDLTTLYTTYLFLKEAGEEYWDDPVTVHVPELKAYLPQSHAGRISWDKITLGDLAAHLGGIGRYIPRTSELDPQLASFLASQSLIGNATASPCATGNSSCTRSEFLSYFGRSASPVFSQASTPIYSNAGFIILAFALESITGHSFTSLLNESLLSPLNLRDTSLLSAPMNRSIIPADFAASQWNSAIPVEAPFNGLYSTLSDVSSLIRSIIRSDFLPQATTNRWLKPVTHTSNSANSVGRPWEIYSLEIDGPSPVIPIYQVRGSIGSYSSHIGIVPDYNVGFAILGADSDTNPDLNAYADLISVAMIPALEENAIMQATINLAGTYTSNKTEQNSRAELIVSPAKDSTPGLAVSAFSSDTTDLFALYAKLNKIKPEDLSFRLFPTDLVEKTASGRTQVFRAVFQDKTALADAGTPTCDSWRFIDELQVDGIGIDEFVFEQDEEGVESIEVRALKLKLIKDE